MGNSGSGSGSGESGSARILDLQLGQRGFEHDHRACALAPAQKGQ